MPVNLYSLIKKKKRLSTSDLRSNRLAALLNRLSDFNVAKQLFVTVLTCSFHERY